MSRFKKLVQKNSDNEAHKKIVENEKFGLFNSMDTAEQIGVEITVYSEADLKSFIPVRSSDRSYNGSLALGGLNSQLMSKSGPETKCNTCSDDPCGGHMGVISLGGRFINTITYKVVAYTLNCVCHICGSLLLDTFGNTKELEQFLRNKKLLSYRGIARLAAIAASSRGVNSHFDAKIKKHQDAMKKSPGAVKNYHIPVSTQNFKASSTVPYFSRKQSDKSHMRIPEEEIYEILSKITPENAQLLGFAEGSHPKDHVSELFPVIPPIYRLWTVKDGGNISQHPLTERYASLIDRVKKFEEKEGNLDARGNVYKAIRDIISSQRVDGRDNRPILKLMSGKSGFFRKNMLGKRLTWCARTVAGPDDTIRPDEVGVPMELKSELLVPVKVYGIVKTDAKGVKTLVGGNSDYIRSLIAKGEVSYILKGEKKLRRKVTRGADIKLFVGDTIMRHLRNGDYVTMNRQPTLSKFSMMCHKVVLKEGQQTFTLAQEVAAAYNKDNDGDEINLHLVMGVEAIAEAEEILSVKNCTISQRSNSPLVSLAFNTITSLYILSTYKIPDDIQKAENDRRIFSTVINSVRYAIDKEPLMKAQNLSLHRRMNEYGVPLGGPHELISMLFPEDFNFIRHPSGNSQGVLIVNGVYLYGKLTKSIVGAAAKSIMHNIQLYYNRDYVMAFIYIGSMMTNMFFERSGFSIGIADCQFNMDEKDEKEIEENLALLNEKELELAKIDVSSVLGAAERQLKEQQINAIMSKINNITEQSLNKDTKSNLMKMATSGAKGSVTNIRQIESRIGQQFFQGERLVKPSEGRSCHFPSGVSDIESKGYCSNSFKSGLTPSETISTMAAGREGTMDTARNTQVVGHAQRMLNIAMGDLVVTWDGTVRNGRNSIYGFSYGSDNTATEKAYPVPEPGFSEAVFFADFSKIADDINIESGWIQSSADIPTFSDTITTLRRYINTETLEISEEKRGSVKKEILDYFSWNIPTESIETDLYRVYIPYVKKMISPLDITKHLLPMLRKRLPTLSDKSIHISEGGDGTQGIYLSNYFATVSIGSDTKEKRAVISGNVSLMGKTNIIVTENKSPLKNTDIIFIEDYDPNYIEKMVKSHIVVLRTSDKLDMKNGISEQLSDGKYLYLW